MLSSFFSDHELSELRARLRATRWPEPWPEIHGEAGWRAGTDGHILRTLVEYWADGYDWDAQWSAIEALPWHSIDLGETPVAYLRFDAEREERLPIILTNGWPSSALELVGIAERLARPSRFGGDPGTSMTVIIPALPGFPFSPQRPSLPSTTVDTGLREQTHELWHRLMTALGFGRYLAHGGDLGAGITSRLAQAHPDAVAGIHLLSVAAPAHVDEDTLTSEEREHLKRVDAWLAAEGGYQHQQQTRPLTLAPALSDSPAGLLSWILEKHRAWSDCEGDVFSRFSPDYLLTLASVYWFSNSIGTSFRPYWEYAAGLLPRVERVAVPTAVALFPHDLASPPRSWAERTYNVTRFTRMPSGGHFAPHEEPGLLAADITEFATAL
ncbi:epoxide hydrolase family protein [Leifsonia sp. AG29]|uniref:epoxide hydrolase family protein n=1 Tax=Leifsonia sp. AG29 TaxID=2598860 RepID=UPI00131BB305|nr:epoxide hydrolase family protein [Leifsonia sp. AG29]